MQTLNPALMYQSAMVSRARKRYLKSGEEIDRLRLKWSIQKFASFFIDFDLPKSGSRLVEIGTREKGATCAQKEKLAELRQELFQEYAPLMEESLKTPPALRPLGIMGRVLAAFATMDSFFIAKDWMSGIWKNNVNDALEAIAYSFIFTGAVYFAKWGLERANRIATKTRGFFKNWVGAAGPLAVMAIASLLEYFQKIGAYPGTYDPKDYLYYAAGCIAAYLLSKPLIHDIFEAPIRKKQTKAGM